MDRVEVGRSSTILNPRRVALVTTELGVGGAERNLVRLAVGLDRTRFESHVFALAAPPPQDRAALVAELEAAGITPRFLGATRKSQVCRAIRELATWFSDLRIDVAQSFLFHANVVAALAARRAGVPRHLTGVRVADPSRWRHRLERWTTRRAERIVCVSQSVANFTRDIAGFPAAKLVVIPNGLDVSLYADARPADPASLGVPPGRRFLVAIGRLTFQKGFDWLLEQATELLSQLPDVDLVFVGDGPDRESLEARARELQASDRVRFAGWRSDLPRVLAASVGLLLPSRWEGMPNVLLEAMAAGKPVIAARVEGVEEVLGPLAAAQAYVPGSGADFLARAITIARDSHLAAMLGRANQERAMEEFSLATMVRRYEECFEV
ncbi:MAG TPA: glycosyltransferase [Pirellulaceae bacterium]|nr:glycosyltransferase [Pirellulaceae bacterium]